MKIHLILFCLLFLSCYHTFGQTHSVSAKVCDLDGLPLVYFNVVIQTETTGIIILSEVYFDGHFDWTHTHAGLHKLSISSLGFKDTFLLVDITRDIDLQTIALQPLAVQLDQAVVRAKQISVRQDGGKIKLQVANSSLVHLSSLADIINRAPGLKFEKEELVVFGKGTPLLYVDNRQVSSYSEIETLQPNEIVSIEIDRNPSAQYDASARAIVRIKTKRLQTNGLALQVYNEATFGKRYNNKLGTRLNYKNGKLNNFIGYEYRNGENRDFIQSYEYNHQNTYTQKFINDAEMLYGRDRHQVLLGSAYNFSDRNALSVQYTLQRRNHYSHTQSKQSIGRNDQIDSFINSLNHGNTDIDRHTINANYSHHFDSIKQLLVTSDYTSSNYKDGQNIRETNLANNQSRLLHLFNQSRSTVFLAKAEYFTQLFGANKLSLGLQYGYVKSSNQSDFEEPNNTSNNYTNDNQTSENNFASYLNFQPSIKKLKMTVGLRYESVAYVAESGGANIRDQMEAKWFPSLSIQSDNWWENMEMSLDYTSKIIRPSMSDLDPAIIYNSSVSYLTGNTLLQPTYIHQLAFQITLFDKLSWSVEYHYLVNPQLATGTNTPDLPNIVIFKPINLDKSTAFISNIGYNNAWGRYTLSVDGGIEFPSLSLPFLNETIRRNKISWNLGVGNDFRFSDHTFLSCRFNYYSKGIELMTDYTARSNCHIGVTQYFCKKRLQVNIAANDIFKTNYTDWFDRFANVEVGQYNKGVDSRSVRVTVRYNINNYKQTYKELSNSSDVERIR